MVVVIASEGDGTSSEAGAKLPLSREPADASARAIDMKGAGHLPLRSSSRPLTQFTRIVPLVLQSIKTTIVNIV